MNSPWAAALDASIFFSFDATGYRRHARGFRRADLDLNLQGRWCLVTGANSGIGFATALGLAERGAEVWLLCRDPGRGEAARLEIVERTGNPLILLKIVDVSSLASVRAFAEAHTASVDVLVHNAGVLPLERALTDEGLEATFATHVAGPFLMTQLLRPALRGARVVWVSSGGMYTQRLSLDDLDWRARRYHGATAYAQTKRMQVVLCELFAERWGGDSVFHAMHPGWADTPAVRASLPTFWRLTRGRLRVPAQGADTVLWLAMSEDAGRHPTAFWFDRAPRSAYLLPRTRERAEDRQALWDLCARLAS